MKTSLVFAIHAALLPLVVSGFVSGAAAQGYVVFDNRVPGIVVAPVYGVEPGNPTVLKHGNTASGMPAGPVVYTGPLLAGTGFTAQLFAGPVGTPEYSLLLVATATFRTGTGAGFVTAPASPVVVPGVSPGGQAIFQVRAWDNVGGSISSWAAVQASLTPRGVSDPFVLSVGSSFANPTYLTGLRSFNITCLSCGTPPFNVSATGGGNLVQGETANFAVSALGQPPLTYQWQFNSNPIGGATNPAYSITNVQSLHTGNYSVAVSNAFGGDHYGTLPLAVFPPPRLTAPFLTAPNDFSLVLTGAPARRYEIQISTNLPAWWPHRTLTNVNGHIPFTDTNAATDPARYYRARVLP